MARNASNVVYSRIEETPIVPLFFNADLTVAQQVLKACYDGGIRVFEFTNRGAEAPAIFAKLIEYCEKECPDLVLGTMTLTEIRNAEILGAKYVKIFPGNVVGPGFVKAIKGPMPKTKIMVTGGVEPNKESLSSWFGAGAAAVGMGSQLFPADLIAKKDYQSISNTISDLIKIYRGL